MTTNFRSSGSPPSFRTLSWRSCWLEHSHWRELSMDWHTSSPSIGPGQRLPDLGIWIWIKNYLFAFDKNVLYYIKVDGSVGLDRRSDSDLLRVQRGHGRTPRPRILQQVPSWLLQVSRTEMKCLIKSSLLYFPYISEYSSNSSVRPANNQVALISHL